MVTGAAAASVAELQATSKSALWSDREKRYMSLSSLVVGIEIR
jgi:hypothetical protein